MSETDDPEDTEGPGKGIKQVMGDYASGLMSDDVIKGGLAQIKTMSENIKGESAFTIFQDADENNTIGTPTPMGKYSSSGHLSDTVPQGKTIVGDVHIHMDDGLPSAMDAYELARENAKNDNFEERIVITNGAGPGSIKYAIAVTDRDALLNFMAANPSAAGVIIKDANGATSFNDNSQIGRDYQDDVSNYKATHSNPNSVSTDSKELDDAAALYATQRAYAKMGITMYQADGNGNFKPTK